MASLRRDKDRVVREFVDFLWAEDGGSNQSQKRGRMCRMCRMFPDVPDEPDVSGCSGCADVPCLSEFFSRAPNPSGAPWGPMRTIHFSILMKGKTKHSKNF